MTAPVLIEAPEPLALVVYGSTSGEVAAWACGKCRCVALDEQRARECCATKICRCGRPIERRHWLICDACENAAFKEKQERKEAAAFEKAVKIPAKDYDGPVTVNGEKFFACVEDLIGEYEEGEEPEYVWACRIARLVFDASDLIDFVLESQEHHEDARDSIADGDVKELQALLNTWVAKQTVETWWEDRTRAVILKDPQ